MRRKIGAFWGNLDGLTGATDSAEFADRIRENCLPLHPRCRCTICATFDTPTSKGKKSGERFAREVDRERAPADMSYHEWKTVYIDKSKPFDEWRAEKDGNVPKHDSSEAELKPRTLQEAKVVADKLDLVVNKYFVRKSKWSGRTIISPDGQNCKLPNCHIGIKVKDCPDEAILHELVHAHSTSYYPNRMYIMHSALEEAAVQYLTQEIAKREKIELTGSDYDYWVENLRRVNHEVGLYEDDLQFARRLLRVPMTMREEWLWGKVRKSASTLEQVVNATELLNKLTWEALEKWIRAN